MAHKCHGTGLTVIPVSSEMRMKQSWKKEEGSMPKAAQVSLSPKAGRKSLGIVPSGVRATGEVHVGAREVGLPASPDPCLLFAETSHRLAPGPRAKAWPHC